MHKKSLAPGPPGTAGGANSASPLPPPAGFNGERESRKWTKVEEELVASPGGGLDMSTPLLLEVAPEIDTNPTRFYRGRGRGVQIPVIGSRSALAMSVHPTYFDLATPLGRAEYHPPPPISGFATDTVIGALSTIKLSTSYALK